MRAGSGVSRLGGQQLVLILAPPARALHAAQEIHANAHRRHAGHSVPWALRASIYTAERRCSMCARATTCPAAAPSRHGSGQMTVALSFGLRSQSAHQARSAASRTPPYDAGGCIHRYTPAPVYASPPSSAQTQHRDLRMASETTVGPPRPLVCVCLCSVPLSFVWLAVLEGMISPFYSP
jgi:hypothetical protein